jgi:hypothetical protein
MRARGRKYEDREVKMLVTRFWSESNSTLEGGSETLKTTKSSEAGPQHSDNTTQWRAGKVQEKPCFSSPMCLESHVCLEARRRRAIGSRSRD